MLSLLLQGGGGGTRLLNECGILLGYRMNLSHRHIDLTDSAVLLARGRAPVNTDI